VRAYPGCPEKEITKTGRKMGVCSAYQIAEADCSLIPWHNIFVRSDVTSHINVGNPPTPELSIHICQPTPLSTRVILDSMTTVQVVVRQLSATTPFPRLQPRHGTVCHHRSGPPLR